nr:hypothetical protein [Tanacetum cinerariifolium]
MSKRLNTTLGACALSCLYASSANASFVSGTNHFLVSEVQKNERSRDVEHSLMQVVADEELTIDASVPADSYDLYDDAVLNIVGGGEASAVDADSSHVNVRVQLNDTEVRGLSEDSSGILAANGRLDAREGSHIFGGVNGVEIIDGYDFYPPSPEDRRTQILLNNSSIEGGTGAAIKVHRPDKYATE